MKPPGKCPACAAILLLSYFDTIWKLPDKTEIIILDLVASLCQKCQQLYVTKDILELEGLVGAKCISAMERDVITYPHYFIWYENNSDSDSDKPNKSK